jgi:general stress protein YciG
MAQDCERATKTIGADFYRENGRRGGEIIKKRYGQEHYQRIGRLGGLKTQEIARKAKEQNG